MASMNDNHSSYYIKNRGYLIQHQRNIRKKIIDEKRFYCEKCDKALQSKAQLNNHLNTKLHLHGRSPFICVPCNFTTNRYSDYTRHNNTFKHYRHQDI